MEWQRYFYTLFAGLPTGGWAHAWRLEGRRTIWVQSVNDAMKAIETLGDKDIYASIGIAAKEGGGPYDRLKKKTAIGYLGVLADLDIFWPRHKEIGKDGKPYPPDAEAVMAFLDTLPLRPTTVVATGHGVQATWLYEEMQPYNWEERNFLPRQVSLAWEKYLNARAAEQGWTAFDSVADVPRVMRVPATVNCKDAEHPVETRLIAITEARYTPQDFLDAMGVAADDLPGMTEEEAEANGPVDDGQRFTEEHPCPICDGHNDMPQGEGIRCWGFISRDGSKVFCTREEYGGVEIETDVGTVYMHDLLDDDPANAYDDSDVEENGGQAEGEGEGGEEERPAYQASDGRRR